MADLYYIANYGRAKFMTAREVENFDVAILRRTVLFAFPSVRIT